MLSSKTKRELKIDQRQILIDSIEIGIPSPQQILTWGERTLPNGKKVGLIKNSKTVNYKRFTPFRDGLFCERIFGPITSFVCACGKKQSHSKVTFCEKCEVEYIDQRSRRYRLGYISLLSPVTHVWYLKGRPSYLSLFLGKRKKTIVALAYCNAYLIEHSPSWANKKFVSRSKSQLSGWPLQISNPHQRPQPLWGMAKLPESSTKTFLSGCYYKPLQEKTGLHRKDLSSRLLRKPCPSLSACPRPSKTVKAIRDLYHSCKRNPFKAKQNRVLNRSALTSPTKKKQDLCLALQASSYGAYLYVRQHTLPFLPSLVSHFYLRDALLNFVYSSEGYDDLPIVEYCHIKRQEPLRDVHRFMAHRTVGSFKNNSDWSVTRSRKSFLVSPKPKPGCARACKSRTAHTNRLDTQESLRPYKIDQKRVDLYEPVPFGHTGPKRARASNVKPCLSHTALLTGTALGVRYKGHVRARKSFRVFLQKTLFCSAKLRDLYLHHVRTNLLTGTGTGTNRRFVPVPAKGYGKKVRGLVRDRSSNQGTPLSDCTKLVLAPTKTSFGLHTKHPGKSSGFLGDRSGNEHKILFSEEKNKSLLSGLELIAIREILSYTGGGALQSLLQGFNQHQLCKFLFAEVQILRVLYETQISTASSKETGDVSLLRGDGDATPCPAQLPLSKREHGTKRNRAVFGDSKRSGRYTTKRFLHSLCPRPTPKGLGLQIRDLYVMQIGDLRARTCRTKPCTQIADLYVTPRRLKGLRRVFVKPTTCKILLNRANGYKGVFCFPLQRYRLRGTISQLAREFALKNKAFSPITKKSLRNPSWWQSRTKPLRASISTLLQKEKTCTMPHPKGVGFTNRRLARDANLLVASPTKKKIYKSYKAGLCLNNTTGLKLKLADRSRLPVSSVQNKSPELQKKQMLRISRRIYKVARRLKIVQLLTRNHRKPEWMILSHLPVLPPDLRPILQMSEKVIVASDLNIMYQRVIYRNNRHLRVRFIDFHLVTAIQRLVQDAVDRLIENGKGGSKPYYTQGGRPLKSLSDILKGKKGRFRLNLLGKRVDFSGRSVIVVSPLCQIHECGLPKEIALELYHYFLLRQLIVKKHCASIVTAKKMIKSKSSKMWEILRVLMYHHPVLLNRAPTLHRLGIQAFQPKLVLGNAILLHPLVCSGFNADFDGDQMGVHLPLSFAARAESWDLLWSRNNLLSPATGQPMLVPSQDMVLGFYYMTAQAFATRKQKHLSNAGVGRKPLLQGRLHPCKTGQNQERVAIEKQCDAKIFESRANRFSSSREITTSLQTGKIKLHTPIWLAWRGKTENDEGSQKPLELRVHSFGVQKSVYHGYIRCNVFTKTQLANSGPSLCNALPQRGWGSHQGFCSSKALQGRALFPSLGLVGDLYEPHADSFGVTAGCSKVARARHAHDASPEGKLLNKVTTSLSPHPQKGLKNGERSNPNGANKLHAEENQSSCSNAFGQTEQGRLQMQDQDDDKKSEISLTQSPCPYQKGGDKERVLFSPTCEPNPFGAWQRQMISLNPEVCYVRTTAGRVLMNNLI